MKTICYVMLVFLIAACSKQENNPEPEIFVYDSEEEFQIDVQNKSADNKLQFRITEINDSRCPSDVVCVWEGMVEVKITIDSPESGSIALNSYNNPEDTVGLYVFRLIEVLPYPISTVEVDLEDYEVTLKIIELEL